MNWKSGLWRVSVVASIVWIVAAFWYSAWLVNTVYLNLKDIPVPYPSSERMHDFIANGLELSAPVFIAWVASYSVRWVKRGFHSRVSGASDAREDQNISSPSKLGNRSS